jgi:hypothetical protein
MHIVCVKCPSPMLVDTKCIYRQVPRPQCRPIFGIGTPPPPLLQFVCIPPPLNQRRGEHTRLRVRWWGSLNSDDWRKSLALCILLVNLWLRSQHAAVGDIYCDTITVNTVPKQTVCSSIYIIHSVQHRVNVKYV